MFPLKDSVVWLIQSSIIGLPIQASGGGGTRIPQAENLYIVAFPIHAPAKGATTHMLPLLRQVAFQSTLP